LRFFVFNLLYFLIYIYASDHDKTPYIVKEKKIHFAKFCEKKVREFIQLL